MSAFPGMGLKMLLYFVYFHFLTYNNPKIDYEITRQRNLLTLKFFQYAFRVLYINSIMLDKHFGNGTFCEIHISHCRKNVHQKKRTKPRAMAQYEFLANNNNSNGTLCELTTTKTTTPPSSQQIEWVNVLWNGVKAPKIFFIHNIANNNKRDCKMLPLCRDIINHLKTTRCYLVL